MPQKKIIISKQEFDEMKEKIHEIAHDSKIISEKPISLREFIDNFMPDIEIMVESGMNFRQIHEILNKILSKYHLSIGLSTLNIYYKKHKENNKKNEKQEKPYERKTNTNTKHNNRTISDQTKKIDNFKTTNPDDL